MASDTAQVEEIVKRLADQKGVVGVLISSHEGVTIRSTMDPEQSSHYGTLATHLARHAHTFVRSLNPEDSLQYLRLRSNGKEIIIAPNFDKEQNFSLMVVQNPAPDG
jgi:predicted regulator of Ras-like GTPase activity (Roadblock/LC7/MglB family)